jgi:tetratricopeptide (TPR) repeat protein
MLAEHQGNPVEMGVPDLANILLKAMALDASHRYQSAVDLSNSLKAWQDTHLISGDLRTAWDLYNKERDQTAAEKQFQLIMARYPTNPQAFLHLARFYIQCSQEDNALVVAGKGIDVSPDYAPLWNVRGRLYAKRNSPLAQQDLQKALALGLSGRDAQQARAMLQRLQWSKNKAATER